MLLHLFSFAQRSRLDSFLANIALSVSEKEMIPDSVYHTIGDLHLFKIILQKSFQILCGDTVLPPNLD